MSKTRRPSAVGGEGGGGEGQGRIPRGRRVGECLRIKRFKFFFFLKKF